MALNVVTIEQDEYRTVLKTPAAAVSFPLSQEDKKFISQLKETLEALGGVGLAAPQVDYPKQIIAVYIPEEAMVLRGNIDTTYPMHVMLNPSYEPINPNHTMDDFEACYSVRTRAGKVSRYEAIWLRYYDESGQFHEKQVTGFYARVVQHEIDHIQGLLIIDRLTKNSVQGTVEEMMALRRASLPKDKQALFDQMVARKLKKTNRRK